MLFLKDGVYTQRASVLLTLSVTYEEIHKASVVLAPLTDVGSTVTEMCRIGQKSSDHIKRM